MLTLEQRQFQLAVVGIAKPYPEILNFACKPLNVASYQCLLIGDYLLNDIYGATSVGMQG